MYFVLFICILLVVKAILKLTYYANNDTFSYYDNISNIVIGVLLFGYTVKMMQTPQVIQMPNFGNGSISNYSVSPSPSISETLSPTASISGFDSPTSVSSVSGQQQ